MADRALPLGFLHIHKTAGTSLSRFIERQFAPEHICPFSFACQFDDGQPLERYRLFRGHLNLDWLEARVGPMALITILRKPRDRIISAYYHWHSEGRKPENDRSAMPEVTKLAAGLSLSEFLCSPLPEIVAAIDNVQARLLAGGRFGTTNATRTQVFGPTHDIAERAVRRLGDFAWVGTAERLDIDGLCRRFGWVSAELPYLNVGVPKEEPLTPAAERRLADCTVLDEVIYRSAQENRG